MSSLIASEIFVLSAIELKTVFDLTSKKKGEINQIKRI